MLNGEEEDAGRGCVNTREEEERGDVWVSEDLDGYAECNTYRYDTS